MMDIFARIGGLNRLAEAYPATGQPGEPELTKQTLQIGTVRFRKCVTVRIGPQGFYLLVRPILSNYTAVLVPWDEVKGTREARIYWKRAIRMSIGSPPAGTITVLAGFYKRMQPYLSSEPQSQ